MSVVFVEALPKGTECEITDYVVETEVNRVLAAFKHEATRYSGPKRMATLRTSSASAI